MTSITDKEFKALENFTTELSPGNVKKAMGELGNSSGDLWNVKPQDVKILTGLNPRIRTPKYAAKIRWLADQIKAFGYYADKPLAGYIAVEDGHNVMYLQDGHGRLEAVLLAISEGAPIKTVPFVQKDRSNDAKDLTIALISSNEGESFSAMEKAILVKRMRVFGSTDTEIAQTMRCSPAYVGQLATLAGAPKKVRDMVINEEISATNAIEAIRKHGDKAVEVLSGALDKAKASGKTKASAKDDAGSATLARQKKHGPALYEMVVALLEHGETVIPESMQQDLDSLLFKIEDAGAKEVAASKGEALL
jgi:ParB-like chromosome segregation protein Spo0J